MTKKLVIKICLIIILFITCFICINACLHNSAIKTASEKEQEYITSLPPIDSVCQELFRDFEYEDNLSKEDNLLIREQIVEYTNTLKIFLQSEIKTSRYEEACVLISKEIEQCEKIVRLYEKDYREILAREEEERKWSARTEEYPTATTVWLHLTQEMGCNDYVAAGIIGNMMAECGGQTLKLNWKAKNSAGHYGLCQWSKGYSMVQGANLEKQLEFISKSFPDGINQWGSICYKKGFDYNDFMSLEDAEEAAYAFCVIYERPGPGSYSQRKQNALIAYEYFTS